MTEDELLSNISAIAKSTSTPSKMTVISIIGGAGSGKTTLAEKLRQKLESAGVLSTDDYVVGDRAYRRDHLSGADPTQKYDPDALNRTIRRIQTLQPNEELPVPTYDQETGLALAAGEENYTRRIHAVRFLIVEGDFDFVNQSDLVIYFDVPDDVRLDNRIVRDLKSRSFPNAQAVVDEFQRRQVTQHLPYTLPVRGRADWIVTVNADVIDDNVIYVYELKPGILSKET